MLESFNYEKKELNTTNQYLEDYIASCHKESERRAVYKEQITEHFNNVADITADSDSITPQKKQNGREKYRHITFNNNEANNSINASKTIEPNASKKFEPNKSKKIEPNASNKIQKLRAKRLTRAKKLNKTRAK